MKQPRLKTNAVASLLIVGAAGLSGCGVPSPRLEYSTKSPNGQRTALVAVEPNLWYAGVMSVTLEPPTWKRGAPWGEIDSLYRAKLGWLDDSTFLIVGDEVQYYLRIKGEYVGGEYPGPVKLITCVRKETDCSELEKRLQPNAVYVHNFQSALATLEEQASKKPIVQVPPSTPAS